ncbi:MAG: alpha/beta hydrolase fold domain-containing protein, partial [Actinobacteria bacterium]|nr:alpha/beta hydrolase fold domain-containing protein [Actinomycetota bacterium]
MRDPEHVRTRTDDCEAAAPGVINNATTEFGSDRVVTGGDSAGGNLVLRTALAARDAGRGPRAYGCVAPSE